MEIRINIFFVIIVMIILLFVLKDVSVIKLSDVSIVLDYGRFLGMRFFFFIMEEIGELDVIYFIY